ncbi:MAG: hypothetical protein AAGG38_04570 [Planctomycetota bacterium]
MNNQTASVNVPITRIALVGHCGFDGSSLSRWLEASFPELEVTRVNDQAALDAVAEPESLLLINRLIEGRFSSASSLDMIRELAAGESKPAMMLISNYPESQAQAVDAGALPGFGKQDIGRRDAVDRLKEMIYAR